MCAQLQFNVCKKIRMKLDIEYWYERVSKVVQTGREGKVTVLWNQRVQALRTFPNNKPDIVIRESEEWTCRVKDVAISGDRSVM